MDVSCKIRTRQTDINFSLSMNACVQVLFFVPGRKYDPIECSFLSKKLSDEIKQKVKELDFKRQGSSYHGINVFLYHLSRHLFISGFMFQIQIGLYGDDWTKARPGSSDRVTVSVGCRQGQLCRGILPQSPYFCRRLRLCSVLRVKPHHLFGRHSSSSWSHRFLQWQHISSHYRQF